MSNIRYQNIYRIIQEDSHMIKCLRIVQELGLPDSWIGAGFIRNKIWDKLHGYERITPVNDIDVIYFDTHNITSIIDKEYEKLLNEKMNDVCWSVKNQARMHVRNNHKPYASTFDAIAHWTETATSIAVQLNEDGLKLIAPYGISDLCNLILRPTPFFQKDNQIFFQRIKTKKWLEQWPKLKVIPKYHG